jgi:hypothetical protein
MWSAGSLGALVLAPGHHVATPGAGRPHDLNDPRTGRVWPDMVWQLARCVPATGAGDRHGSGR